MVCCETSTNSWERISGVAWRSTFLHAIESLHSFEELVTLSRSPNLQHQAELASKIGPAAAKLLAQYSSDDLRIARLSYNSQQLVAFWRHYHTFIHSNIQSGRLAKRFPLLSATTDPSNDRIVLEAINIVQIEGGLFTQLTGTPHPSFEFTKCDGIHFAQSRELSRKDVIDSLHGRLTNTIRLACSALPLLYTHFIAQERTLNSAIWEAYKIHIFLDTFMYRESEGGDRTSRFELIFFANNLQELIIFLEAAAAAGKRLSTKMAKDFLKSQTQYYLALSQRISLEENEILNSHKELLNYDEARNIVRLSKVPAELLEESGLFFK